MSNGTVSTPNAVQVLASVSIAITLAGCNLGASPSGGEHYRDAPQSAVPADDLAHGMLPEWYPGAQPVLRYRLDAARGRLWVLTESGFEIYHLASRSLLARGELPGWVWVGEPFSCAPPDLALGPKGEALVSSNVLPRLWRIDPASHAVSEHELTLDEDADKDVGFSGVVYSAPQGVYFAVSSVHGSLWRIDPLLRRAQKIALSSPLPRACAPELQLRSVRPRDYRLAGLCVRGLRGGQSAEWVMQFAPDQRSAYLRSSVCAV